MKKSPAASRREFVKQAAVGAITLGAAETVRPQKLLAKDIAGTARRKSNIRLSVRMNAHWFNSKSDEDLHFVKQIGADYVNIDLRLIDVRNERDWNLHETVIDGESARRCVIGANDGILDGFTVTQGSTAFYALGAIDSFGFGRQFRFDLQLRITDGNSTGAVQVSNTDRLSGPANAPFDSGTLVITGAGNSAVTAEALGSGVYRLEVDTNGDGNVDRVFDGVTF